MMDWFLFTSALVAVYLTPGPDMVLVVSTSMNGPRQAIAVALGLALARGLHVMLAAAGLAALLATTPWAYNGIRLIGAVYLLYLAWRFLTMETGNTAHRVGNPEDSSLLRAFNQGVLTNALNPKALIFCSVLLPQFVDPAANVAAQFGWLGVILVSLGLVFDLVFALMGRGILVFTASRKGVQTMWNRLFGLLLAALGLKVGLV